MIVLMFVKSLGNCPWSVFPLFQDTASSSASENDGAGGGPGRSSSQSECEPCLMKDRG